MMAKRERTDEPTILRPVESPGRVPPQDLDAEAAVLSAVLMSGDALDSVEGLVGPLDFYSDANRRILAAAHTLQARGQPVDVVTIATYLKESGRLEQCGGSKYLSQVVDATPSVGNVEAHAKIVRQAARLRTLIASCQVVAAEGYDLREDFEPWLQRSEASLYEACKLDDRTVTVSTIRETLADEWKAIQERQASKGGPPGLSFGVSLLDHKTGGMRDGNLIYLAARPGMGKTSLAIGIARYVAATALAPVLYVSPEMERPELTRILLGQAAGIDTMKIGDGSLTPGELSDLADATAWVEKLPIVFDDRSSPTPSTIRSLLRRESARAVRAWGKPIRLVVVDHLQKLALDRKFSSRESELEYLSGELKRIAKDFACPVLALSQLSRAGRERGNPRPVLTDLRGSGAIEQDADAVVMIHRPDYYEPDEAKHDGTASAIVTKARAGKTGDLPLRFLAFCQRFEEDQAQ